MRVVLVVLNLLAAVPGLRMMSQVAVETRPASHPKRVLRGGAPIDLD